MHNPTPRCQRRLREKSGAAISHGQQRLTVDARFKIKLEQPGVTLPEEMVDANVVADHLARARQAAMKTDLGVEQAVHRTALRLKIDTEKAGQKQIRLPRFNCDAGGNAAAIEIPRAGVNVVLGDDTPLRHRQRLALNLRDAIHQHQWFVRQTHARGERIGSGELRPEHTAHQTTAEFETGGAVERTRNAAGRNSGNRRSERHVQASSTLQQTHLHCHCLRQRFGQALREAQIGLMRRHRGLLCQISCVQHHIVELCRRGNRQCRLRRCNLRGHLRCHLRGNPHCNLP